jgi:hypothetical protein
MDKSLKFNRSFSILSGLSGVAGVILLIVSFAINNGPPPGATSADLVKFGQQNYAHILWGAWMQAVGPVLIVSCFLPSHLFTWRTPHSALWVG